MMSNYNTNELQSFTAFNAYVAQSAITRAAERKITENAISGLVGQLLTELHGCDVETSGHVLRVAAIASRIGRELELTTGELATLQYGAMLHDIGKLTTDPVVLKKPTSLTVAEMEHVRQHAAVGAKILRNLNFPQEIIDIVHEHHERWDGKGYPIGLSGIDICLGARIVAVADTLDAMLSKRCYRHSCSFAAARAEINAHSGTQFDPAVVRAFLAIDKVEWK